MKSHPFKLIIAVVATAALAGCKVRTLGAAGVKESDAAGVEIAFKPYDQLQVGARKKASGGCAEAGAIAPADWVDAGDQKAAVGLSFPPGSTLVAASPPAPLDQSLWDVGASPDERIVIISSKKAESYPVGAIGKLVGKDTVDWTASGPHAAAAEAGYAEAVGKGLTKLALIVARKNVQSLKAPSAQPVPAAVKADAASYDKCGDGMATKLITARDMPIFAFGADDASLNAGKALMVKALGAGLDSSDEAALKQLIAGKKFAVRLFTQEEGKPIDVSDDYIATVEFFKGTDAAGMATAVYTATPYPAYKDGLGQEAADFNAAIRAAAQARAGLAVASGDAATLRPALDALDGTMTACGAQRFNAACRELAAKTAALAGVVPNPAVKPITPEREKTIWVGHFCTKSTPRNQWTCVMGTKPTDTPESRTLSRNEVQTLWRSKEFQKKIYVEKWENYVRGFPDSNNPMRSRGGVFDEKYEYFWLRPKAGSDGKRRTVARIENKKDADQRIKFVLDVPKWSDNVELELTFQDVDVTDDMFACGLCIFSDADERGTGIIDENPEP
jgi:hypothetical protein